MTTRYGLLLMCMLSLLATTTAAQLSDADTAAEIARTQTGGRVLSVTPLPDGPGYEVKVLLGDGRVRTLHIDPR